MPRSYWTSHFYYWLGAAFSDVPVLLSLQQKDVTLSLKSVIILFQYRVIPSGCSVLKNQGNHKAWPCWPMNSARKLELFLPSARRQSYPCLNELLTWRHWWAGVGGQQPESARCGALQVWCVCTAGLCWVMALGAQSGSVESTALVLAELSRMDSAGFANRGLRQNSGLLSL